MKDIYIQHYSYILVTEVNVQETYAHLWCLDISDD